MTQDFAVARTNMVENQVRTNDVTDLAVQDAMRVVPRERLCGPKAALAYAEAPVAYAPGYALAEPRTVAKLLQAISPQPGERALAVAAPYAALVLAQVGCKTDALQPPGVPSEAVASALADAGVTLTSGELTEVSAGPFDVILANAVLQWVPSHEVLMPRLIGKLAEGGSLAVQMPDNLDEPAHRLMREVAGAGPWSGKLTNAAGARSPRLPAEWYYALLRPHVAQVDVWSTTYYHVLAGGTDAVVEWFKGSGLRPFLAPLDTVETEGFLKTYRAALVDAYPPLPDGSVLLPFPRLFFVATR